MTHEETCRRNNELDIKAREENRMYRTLKENAEMKHREAIDNEQCRFMLEMRRLRLEHESRMDDINRQKDECRIEFARQRDQFEGGAKAPMQPRPRDGRQTGVSGTNNLD